MARSLTVGSALTLAASKSPKLLQDGWGARFADEVLSYMWTRYPWKQSIVELPPFHLVADEPDYGAPLLAVPSDLFALHSARVRNSNGYIGDPLDIRRELGIMQSFGEPRAIAYQKEVRAFRVSPIPNVSAPDWWIEGSYKTTLTKVTNLNANSYILPFDDVYFSVFRQGLAWKIKQELLEDPKADLAFILFSRMLERMASDEGVNEGADVIVPSDPLELGGYY